MLRFPPRLTLQLAKVRIAQKLSGAARHPLALHVDLADFATSQSASAEHLDASASTLTDQPDAPSATRESRVLTRIRDSHAPFVWIGGDTPLHYPAVGQLAREIVDLGRTVFLEMDGTLLRRRIHEFKPVSRLYLVLSIHGLPDAHDSRAGKKGNFRATCESIRTARLSGFHVCALTTIHPDSQLGELREIAELLATLNLDGWIQIPAAPGTVSAEQLAAARALIANSGWKNFSAMLSVENFAPVNAAARDSRASGPPNLADGNEPRLKHIPEPPANNEGLPAL